MNEVVYEAADVLDIQLSAFFERAFRWFHGQASRQALDDFHAWQEDRNTPGYVRSFAQEVVHTGQRARLLL